MERFLRGRFHAAILGGHFQVAPKGGFTSVVQTMSKRVFSTFPHGGQTKKHSLEHFERGRFHATILGGHFQVAAKGGCTKVVEMSSKRVFSTFPIGAKRKNTLWNVSIEVGFMPPFWVFLHFKVAPTGGLTWALHKRDFLEIQPNMSELRTLHI